jgi:hypothetical protein
MYGPRNLFHSNLPGDRTERHFGIHLALRNNPHAHYWCYSPKIRHRRCFPIEKESILQSFVWEHVAVLCTTTVDVENRVKVVATNRQIVLNGRIQVAMLLDFDNMEVPIPAPLSRIDWKLFLVDEGLRRVKSVDGLF